MAACDAFSAEVAVTCEHKMKGRVVLALGFSRVSGKKSCAVWRRAGRGVGEVWARVSHDGFEQIVDVNPDPFAAVRLQVGVCRRAARRL